MTFVVTDYGCDLCRCLDVFISCSHFVEGKCGPLLNSSQRTYCTSLCFTQAVIWETLKVLFVAIQVENDSWLWRRIGMFCILRLHVILVKSSMCPSKTTFSIVDIVSEGIQESKEAGDPSRHLIVQRLPPFSTYCTLSFYFTYTYAVDNHLKMATAMNANSTNKDSASTFQALQQFPPWFIHISEYIHSHICAPLHHVK